MAPPKIRPSTSTDIGSIPPAKSGTSGGTGTSGTEGGAVRRSGAGDVAALKGLAGNSGPRLARGVFGSDPAARAEGRVVNVPAPGITAGDALGRLRDEHPEFSGNRTQLQAAWDARLT